MASQFLDELTLSDEERAKLAKLGARTPVALLAMRKASKQAFDDYIGQDRADVIATELDSLLTDEERESLKGPAKRVGRLGARLDPPPEPNRS